MYKEIIEDKMLIKLEEDLIAPNVRMFKENVGAYFAEDTEALEEVVLSLKSTENIDSVGVTFVIGLYKKAEEFDLEFSIIEASEEVVQLFKLMKLDHLIYEE